MGCFLLRDPAEEEEEESAFSAAACIIPCFPTFPHRLLYLTLNVGVATVVKFFHGAQIFISSGMENNVISREELKIPNAFRLSDFKLQDFEW